VSNLPDSWINVQLGDVVDYGNTSKIEPTEISEDSWILELEDIEKTSSKLIQRILFSERQSKSTKNKFEKNDVLYGKLRPYLDKVIIAQESGCCTTEIIPIKPGKYLDKRFLFYGLKRKEFIDYVSEVSHGLNMPRLGTKQGQAAPFVLAPLNEQIRIADKLDSVLAKVDAAQARLEKIPTLLKRFRQSVLAAATSGELTREWRENDEFEISEENIVYPNSWDYLTIDDIGEVKGGKRLPKGEKLVSKNTGYPYIKAGQLKNGTVDPAEQEYLEASIQKKISRYIVNKDDAFITIVGACIGDAGLIPENYDGANLTENAAKICNYKRPLNPKYLSFWLQSEALQKLIQFEIKSGAQGKLALKRIKTLPIPYPNEIEQKEIIRRVESLFALADTVEKQYFAAKQRLDRLTQSLLAKAFRGELVTQAPTDEPATELLKRIQTERKAQPPVKHKRPKSA
jgi:type I restriction enzyme, S subunit